MWLCWLCAYPSIERLILCGLVPCLLCRGCCCLREEYCAPSLYYPNPQRRFPVWEVLCGCIIGNPSMWRRGRRAVARTSKYIFVFAFDPLSLNSLSLLYLALIHIAHILYAWYCLCASLVLNQEIFIFLNSYLEEFRGDSPEPFTGNSATLFGYTKCVAISFSFRIIYHYISHTPIHPPLGVFSKGWGDIG